MTARGNAAKPQLTAAVHQQCTSSSSAVHMGTIVASNMAAARLVAAASGH